VVATRRRYESTDDAFIDARTVQISSQVSAGHHRFPVTDNQWSKQAPAGPAVQGFSRP